MSDSEQQAHERAAAEAERELERLERHAEEVSERVDAARAELERKRAEDRPTDTAPSDRHDA